jgi:phosphoribosylanthranilate isomerase
VIHVKVCGITSVSDALACAEAGVSAIGLNFVPASPRAVDVPTARSIADALAGTKVLVVGVVADLSVDAMKRLREEARLGCLQLHGDEPPRDLEPLLPHAYKALRVADAREVARADDYPGEHVLVDAKVAGVLGGTGVRVDPALVAGLARRRKLTLAGGLTPANVASAIREVRPFAVDVASGVERAGEPRRKDLAAVSTFLSAVKSALLSGDGSSDDSRDGSG